VEVGEMSFNGQDLGVTQFRVLQKGLLEGDNLVTLETASYCTPFMKGYQKDLVGGLTP
jgi:hypothetical protein